MSETPSPTGIPFSLRRGDVAAEITQVGASLRHLAVGGVNIVPPYPADEPTPMASGVVLVPWPNRIRDGVWQDGDVTRALAITEPKLRNASHGLLRFTAYDLVEQSESSLTLRGTIVPQTGYPYLVETTVTYALTDAGIEVTHTLTNHSATTAPACGRCCGTISSPAPTSTSRSTKACRNSPSRPKPCSAWMR